MLSSKSPSMSPSVSNSHLSSSPSSSIGSCSSRRLSSVRCRSGHLLGSRYDKRMPAASIDSIGCRSCRLPLQHSTDHVDIYGPVVPIIHPGADSWVEGWQPECTPFGLPRVSSQAVHLQEPVFDIQDLRDVQPDTLEQERFYREHFLSKTHVNYCANDNIGPIVMSVRYEENSPDVDDARFRLVIRTPSSTLCRLYPAETYGDDPQVEDLARTALPDLPSSIRFQSNVSSDLQNAILEYDEHTKQSRFKFGVLTQDAGQCTEEAIFSNNKVSDSFSKFLHCVSSEVDLQGFEGFRGGLDVKSNLSGKKSFHTKFDNRLAVLRQLVLRSASLLEIMFHVSALMPFSVTDSQQVARKRHIGNDIVCVVFQEEATTFDPNWIASSFLHTYVVVQPVSGAPSSPCSVDSTVDSASRLDGQTFYRISICSKKSVPPFLPLVPSTGVFPLGQEFRNFFLTLLINAERSSTKAEQFAKLERRTREHLLKDLYQAVYNSCDVTDSPADTSSGKEGGRWSGVRKLIPKKQRGVSSAGSRHSLASQLSGTSPDPVKLDGKGLLNFFRGNSLHSLSSKSSRSRPISGLIFTRERSASARACSAAEEISLEHPEELAFAKALGPSSLSKTSLNMEDKLKRSSHVVSQSDKENTPVTRLGEVSSVPVTLLNDGNQVNENGAFPSAVHDLSQERLTSAVELLRRTVLSLKEERTQLLREDVAMKARLAEYEVREIEQRRELLEARAEMARLRAQLALATSLQSDTISCMSNGTSCTVTNL